MTPACCGWTATSLQVPILLTQELPGDLVQKILVIQMIWSQTMDPPQSSITTSRLDPSVQPSPEMHPLTIQLHQPRPPPIPPPLPPMDPTLQPPPPMEEVAPALEDPWMCVSLCVQSNQLRFTRNVFSSALQTVLNKQP